MSGEVRHLVDIEEEHLSRVRFGRNRFLRMAGVALFGTVTATVAAQRRAEAAPYPCSGPRGCYCCNGANCCSRNCRSTGYCWWQYDATASYKCCDYRDNGGFCVCSGRRPVAA